jgi:cis-3-alkyl-4-acyloxetan-2-one decarboxylase
MVMTAPSPKIDTTAFGHLYPFASHFLTINGLRYHYLDEGRGEPLVMVHGNPTWSFYFRNLVLAFRDSYRVIVPDHMGCGLSDKPTTGQYDFRLQSRVNDLAALLDHLDLRQPVTLVLHDWGGMIGLAWALRHPQQVARLVITNTAGFFPPGNKSIPWRLKLIRTPNILINWCVLHLNLFARGALFMAPHKPLPPAVKAGLIAPYNCPGHRLATLKFVQDIPLTPDDPSGAVVAQVSRYLEELGRRPTLIVWGAHDFVFDRDYFNEWRRRLPGAHTCWLDTAGHYLLEDEPETVIAEMKAFLDAQG